ncbi:hypothetical protein [Methylobacterium sp. WL19]|uniref:hypothetical protein n=1 Tax=Methylobacterium sp. WL19 TaxID=2603896 RepID=UPI0011CC2B33|nr:hypothetical protein [Methylobacterium sp. WL19]TXN21894.1 hypothetical protein FV220_22550 [Methylobacterium sp. WL19]
MWKMYVAGLIGGVASLTVAALTPILTWIPGKMSEVSADNVLSQLEVKAYPGRKLSPTTFQAECYGKRELIVSGYCQINNGGGTIQNVGSVDGVYFTCVYSNPADATAYALCLRRKD